MIELALEAYRLKDTVRTGWMLRGVRDAESVAGHSWGTALLCILFADLEKVSAGKAVQIAVVHDLAECRVGDMPARVDVSAQPVSPKEKNRLEREAMEELAALVPHDGTVAGVHPLKFVSLWEEYENRSTPEAVFVRDMNLIDMCLTALLYERDHRYDPEGTSLNFPDFEGLDEFFATAGPRLSTGTGRVLFQEVHRRYLELSTARGDGSAG